MRLFLSLLLVAVVACHGSLVDSTGGPSTPANLTYELEPSGDPNSPSGDSAHLGRCHRRQSRELSRLFARIEQWLVRPARRDELQHIPR